MGRIRKVVFYMSKRRTRYEFILELIGSLEQELKQLRKDGAKVEAQQLHSQLHELKKLYIPFHNETEREVSRLTAIITKEVGASVSFPKFKLFVEEARNEFQSRYG